MLGNVQNRNFNQVAFTGIREERTMKEIITGFKKFKMTEIIDRNQNLTAQITNDSSSVKGPCIYRETPPTGAIISFIKGCGFGTGKVLSGIAKLPWKMLEAAGKSLIKDTKELGTYIRSESNLAKATLKARGHDKAAKILTEL